MSPERDERDLPGPCRSKDRREDKFAVRSNLVLVRRIQLVGGALKWQLAILRMENISWNSLT
jgi:hypothetical protein